MLTQTIMVNLTQSKLSAIIMRSEEKGRQIRFEIIDAAGEAVDLTEYAVKFIMLKPDDNIVMTDAVGGVVTQTEQMTTAKGAGYYCIRLIDDDTVVYSGQGKVLIDDHVVDDETMNSISEVDGLIFPDDFLTVDDHVAVIDDNTTSTESTWSSDKISDELNNISVDVSKTATGNPIDFTDGAAAPLVKCVTQITGYQQGSGTPSPDNIRPITAYTEGEIEVRGRNMAYLEQGTINIYTGLEEASTIRVRTNFIDVVEGQSYIAKSQTNGWSIRNGVGYDENNNRVASGSYPDASTGILTVPIGLGIKKMRFIYSHQDGAESCTPSDYWYQFEKGTTATPYEPYVGTTHTTTYPSAIYRGSEDCVKGEVTSEWGMIASYAGETLPGEWISDRDEYAPGTTPTTGAQVAYQLATPTTSSVTPTNLPIRTLSGYNHIESSTGDLDIRYIKQPYEPIIKSAEQADNDLIRITAAYDAASLSNTDVTINYKDYDALVIYVNDALTQCGVSSVFTKEYLEYCQTNSRTLTFFPFGSAYVSYNIMDNKLGYAGDNNHGFYIIRIDGINFRR